MEFANRFFKRDHPDLLANICKNYQTKPNQNTAAQNLQQDNSIVEQLTAFKNLYENLLQGITLVQRNQSHSSYQVPSSSQISNIATSTQKPSVETKIEPKDEVLSTQQVSSTIVKIESQDSKESIAKIEPVEDEKNSQYMQIFEASSSKTSLENGQNKVPEKVPSFIRKLSV
uniref:Uncharacterized protein n=1 Tax=Acrobeloides nanus TaxID=290746 RepID=A0A914DSQ6_9BILA